MSKYVFEAREFYSSIVRKALAQTVSLLPAKEWHQMKPLSTKQNPTVTQTFELQQQIRCRAYEIFEQRGREEGTTKTIGCKQNRR